MKYRIQIQQVFGGNWSNMEEATKHAEWLECDNIKPRSRVQGLAALEEKANLYKNGAPHRLVALHSDGTFEVHYTITRGTAFFPASVRSVVKATRMAAVLPAQNTEPKYRSESGDTWESVYVTDCNGDEVTTIGWIDDCVIDSMNAKHYAKHGSTLTFTFEGGNMDGATV